MSEDLHAIARMLDDLVRTVPGVVSVFAADPTLVRTAKQVTSFAEDVPLVSVSALGEGLAVTVSVGVDGEEQAPLTAASVAAAVRSALPGREVGTSVRVSRIAR